MISAHNLLADAVMETPNMKLEDIRKSLEVLNQQIANLVNWANGRGIPVSLGSD
jgi:hypothetical protein